MAIWTHKCFATASPCRADETMPATTMQKKQPNIATKSDRNFTQRNSALAKLNLLWGNCQTKAAQPNMKTMKTPRTVELLKPKHV